MREIRCRCGGKAKVRFRDEHSKGVLIRNVPILVCERCSEEWYPPGIPRMIEGIRESIGTIDSVDICATKEGLPAKG